jgi:alpha-beta hydrolase superfamily lysophospholipase
MASSSAGATSSSASAWVETEVSFRVDQVTIYATYRHRQVTSRGPAALLIAGSGPTDRNGNSTIAGAQTLNSLRLLADQLSTDGVATLRYDKLFSGQTGGGRFTLMPTAAGVDVFTAEAAGALRYLAAQPGTDPRRLSVYGHSEGGLYALLLATGHGGDLPAIHSLGLIEPQSRRILDILREQLRSAWTTAQRQGQLTQGQVRHDDAALDSAIAAVRANRAVPPGLPSGVAELFGPAVVPYLRDDDAARLPKGLPVLLTCSSADAQVSCADTDHLAVGVRRADVTLSYAHLTDMDHDLKHDTSRTPAGDARDLSLSPTLVTALQTFTR